MFRVVCPALQGQHQMHGIACIAVHAPVQMGLRCVGLCKPSGMWDCANLQVCGDAQTFKYVGLCKPSGVWDRANLQVCGDVQTFKYVGLCKPSGVWDCANLQVCGTVQTFRYVGPCKPAELHEQFHRLPL